MKKLLSIFGTISLITTGASSVVACGAEKTKDIKQPTPVVETETKENQKLKEEIKKLQDENQKLKWKIDKSVLFIDYINPPLIITANKVNEVKEYELISALKPKILEAVKTIDDSLTENDFIIGFKNYFNHMQPRNIDLSTPKKIIITIIGKNKIKGEKDFNVILPAILKK